MVKTEDAEKKEEVVPVNNTAEEKITPTSNLETTNETQANNPIVAPVDDGKDTSVSL